MGSGSLTRTTCRVRSSTATPAGSRRSRSTPDNCCSSPAAEPVGDPLLLRDACAQLEIAPSAIDATDGLLVVDERVTFLHPWPARPSTGSPTHRAAGSSPGARAGHRSRASIPIVAPGIWRPRPPGPTRRWRTSSSCRPGRAKARGGQAAAAAFLQRAVALTGDPERRADRALEAAQANLGAGAFDAARRLLAIAEAGPLDELGHARIELLRAEIVFAQRRGGDAPLLLLRAAKRLEPLDVRLARDTYLDAWGAALFAGHLASDGGGLLDVSRAAAAAPDAGAGRTPA